MKKLAISALVLPLLFASHVAGGTPVKSTPQQDVVIPAGTYVPLYGQSRNPIRVASFKLDRFAVTRAQYAAFVVTHPEWGRNVVKAPGYLADWRGNNYGDASDATRPVTSVTRAAAAAYCSAQHKRLPSTDEWEYAAAASPSRRDGSIDPAFKQMLVSLYTRSRASRPDRVGSQFRNAYGVNDMHGLIWEWVAQEEPMTMKMPADKQHAAHDLSCAGSANGASDATNFAAFLRYAFRSGLNETSTSQNLGFRCAGSV